MDRVHSLNRYEVWHDTVSPYFLRLFVSRIVQFPNSARTGVAITHMRKVHILWSVKLYTSFKNRLLTPLGSQTTMMSKIASIFCTISTVFFSAENSTARHSPKMCSVFLISVPVREFGLSISPSEWRIFYLSEESCTLTV